MAESFKADSKLLIVVIDSNYNAIIAVSEMYRSVRTFFGIQYSQENKSPSNRRRQVNINIETFPKVIDVDEPGNDDYATGSR